MLRVKNGLLVLASFLFTSSIPLIEIDSNPDLNKILNVKNVEYGSHNFVYSKLQISESSKILLATLNVDYPEVIWKHSSFDERPTMVKIVPSVDSNLRDGFYKIKFFKDLIIIEFMDKSGLIYSFDTLIRFLEQNKGTTSVKQIIDYPDINRRFVHLVLPKKKNESLNNLIELSRLHRFNGVILQIKDRMQIEESDSANWSVRDIAKIKEICHNYGMRFIVEIKFLTHQNKSVFKNQKLINKHTYDPLDSIINLQIIKILDIINNEIGPDGVHIGFDELHGYRNDIQRRIISNKLQYRKYFDHLTYLYDILAKRNLEVYMWADMLMNPEEFPNLTAHGFSEILRIIPDIPESLILCDWQYWSYDDYSSHKFLSSKGNMVFASTWCNTNSIDGYLNYVKVEKKFSESSMLCTTWPGALLNKREKIIRKGCDLLSAEAIIEYSGDRFWGCKN